MWKNYTCNQKPDVHMKLTITQSGLKAFTKDHGLTEYWSHRITYCLASPQFPRIFCWVYRHEGRKLKQELRCHAVVCAKESVAKLIAGQLQGRLAQALNEFKRDKISRQNARLSLANSVYDNPSLPRRKILLSTGSHNYRPPLERSKSAPRLMCIEECLEEDEELADGAAFKRCRAENRLRTGTLRNRMGGLYGFRDTVATGKDQPNQPPIENRLVDSSQGRDKDDEKTTDNVKMAAAEQEKEEPVSSVIDRRLILRDADDEAVAAAAAAVESLPSYLDATAADGQQPSAAVTATAVVDRPRLQLPPKYSEVIVACPQGPEDVCYKYNSLVRDRKKLFENIGNGGDRFKRLSSDSELLVAYNNLVKNRKLLFEGCCRDDDEEEQEEDLDLDLDELLLDEEDKDCGYPDDDESTTPSLQSVSSGGSAADAFKKVACTDLDSLSEEEDSDESGYVEAPPPARCPADVTPADERQQQQQPPQQQQQQRGRRRLLPRDELQKSLGGGTVTGTGRRAVGV